MRLVDIGVNLCDKSFANDRALVIAQAKSHGVAAQIVTGTELTSSRDAITLCQTDNNYLFSTAGFHPHHAKDFQPGDLATLEQLVLENDCVRAVGECGLDFNRNFSPPDVQCDVFARHLDLAARIQYPLFMHERDAHTRFLEIFSDFKDKVSRGVVHCFTGNREALMAYLDLGLYIGITGWICDERRGQELLSLLSYIPLDRMMIETDAPYLLPRDLNPKIKPKSRRNEPQYLPHIAQTIARALKLDLDTIANQTYLNSQQFFELPAP